MTGAAPGWYHAEGDPPNTERYWDGTQWTEGPRPIGGMPSTPPASEPTPGGTPGLGGLIDTGSSDVSDRPDTSDMPEMPDMPETPDVDAPTSMPSIDTGYTPPTGGPPPIVGSSPGIGGGLSTPAGGPTGLPAPSMGTPPEAGAFYTEESKATTSLILSIVGFFCCGLASLAGVYYAREEQKGITAGLRDPSKQGLATAALVIGIIGGVLWLMVVGFVALGVLLSA